MHYGIQSNGTCPLLVMLPFTDERTGPPSWATHHIKNPSEFDRNARSVIGEKQELDEIDWGDEQEEEIYGFGWWPSSESLSRAAFSWLASAQLAIEHFDARDPSVVPLLAEQEFQSCPITFSMTSLFVNTEYHKSAAFDHALKASLSNPICAVIGPETYDAVQAVSYITDDIKIPQLAYGTIDERLTNAKAHPSVARPTTDNHEFTEAIIQYLQRPGKRRDYIALVHDLEQYGEQIEHTIFEVLDKYGMQLTHHHIVHDIPSSALDAMDFVRQDGYRTFILATDQTVFLDRIAEAADALGLLGEEYFYVIIDLTLPSAKLSSIRNEVDSPLDKLLRGAALFRILEPFQYKNSDEDRFLNSWKKQGDDFVERVNALHPLAKKDKQFPSAQGPEYFVANEGYFQDTENTPSPLSSLIYDSVMLAGISACRVRSSSVNKTIRGESFNSHLETILQTEFYGASGKVKFDEGENSRLHEGIVFGAYNILPGVVDEMSGKRGYVYSLTSINSGSGWEDVEGTEFKFFSGKSDQPMPLRTVFDNNYLPLSMHIFGLIMVALAILIAVGSALWVYLKRKEALIKAAQPSFLYCLCFGSVLVSISLIFVSFDESYGWTEKELSQACATFPWFLCIGYLVQYCALYCKLYRINMVFSMVRRKVTITQVLLPFVLIIMASIAILLVWTVVDPLQWERRILVERPLETYGSCSSSNLVVFAVLLCLLAAMVTAMTMWVSWKARDIQAEFCEWTWVFYGIFLHLQMMSVGIPLYIILIDVSRAASHMISTFLIFAVAVVLVVTIIWPKKYAMRKIRASRRQSSVSFGVTPRGPNVRVSGVAFGNSLNNRLNNSTLNGGRRTSSCHSDIERSTSNEEPSSGINAAQSEGKDKPKRISFKMQSDSGEGNTDDFQNEDFKVNEDVNR